MIGCDAVIILPGQYRKACNLVASERPVEGDTYTFDGRTVYEVTKVFKGVQSFQRNGLCPGLILRPL